MMSAISSVLPLSKATAKKWAKYSENYIFQIPWDPIVLKLVEFLFAFMEKGLREEWTLKSNTALNAMH